MLMKEKILHKSAFAASELLKQYVFHKLEEFYVTWMILTLKEMNYGLSF